MSKIFTLAKPRPGDWNGLIVIAADIERDLNKAIPFRFGTIADGQYLIRNGGSIVGASGPSGLGAPVGASYVTLAADATLTSERVLGVGSPLVLTDFGPGAAAQITFATQNANLHFLGPTSGGPAAPAFRALILADVPDGSLGTGVTSSSVYLRGDRTWAAAVVSSIAWSAITGTPTTLAGYGITDAYTKTASDARYAPIAHTHDAADVISGVLTQARGGTGFGTYTKGDVLYASALNTLSRLALGGTDGFVFTSNTTSGLPEWRALPAPTVYAPLGASYITVALDASLTSERTLGTASPLALTDTGPNGSISVGFSNQSQNLVLAGPASGAAASPTFRALVALDIPSHVHSAADITTGVLAIARGGTNLGTYTKGDLLYASAANVLAQLAIGGTDGFVLTTNTTTGLPEWRTLPAQTVYAPLGASYITIGLDPSLTAERTLGVSSPLNLTDTGPNGSATVGFSSQSANTVLAGPVSAGPSVPSFRGLAAADIPALPESQITNLVTDLAAKALAGLLLGSYDIGTALMATGQFLFQFQQLRLSGAERFTAQGSSTTVLTDLGTKNSIIAGSQRTFRLNFKVPTDYFLDQVQRMELVGAARGTFEGNATVLLTDDFQTRSRVVLAGRGN